MSDTGGQSFSTALMFCGFTSYQMIGGQWIVREGSYAGEVRVTAKDHSATTVVIKRDGDDVRLLLVFHVPCFSLLS